MSYTDLLQSYQDRLSSMVQNEDSVGDYLLNKSQEKINSYLEQAGIPSQVGSAFEQVGLLANNSAVKTLLEKSGLKGVIDEKIEALSRNIDGLKDQVKSVGQQAASAVDEQVTAAQARLRPLVGQSQELIQSGRAAETQVREGITAARGAAEQAQGAVEQAVGQVRGAAEQAVGQARGAAQEGMAQLRGTAEELTQRVPTLDEALAQIGTRPIPAVLSENIPEGAGELIQGDILGQATSRVLGGLPPRGVIEEPNIRPSQVARDLPEFQTPTQQLPQVPQAAAQPSQPTAETPQPTRPTGYEPPEEMVSRVPPPGEMEQLGLVGKEGEQLSNIGQESEQVISTVGKVGTGLEETTGELPGIGEIGEVFGALLQIGSLIASAFKPHEDVQTITTPITGFGFGSMNQFGVGGSSIV